jgi:hypothetical protein
MNANVTSIYIATFDEVDELLTMFWYIYIYTYIYIYISCSSYVAKGYGRKENFGVLLEVLHDICLKEIKFRISYYYLPFFAWISGKKWQVIRLFEELFLWKTFDDIFGDVTSNKNRNKK